MRFLLMNYLMCVCVCACACACVYSNFVGRHISQSIEECDELSLFKSTDLQHKLDMIFLCCGYYITTTVFMSFASLQSTIIRLLRCRTATTTPLNMLYSLRIQILSTTPRHSQKAKSDFVYIYDIAYLLVLIIIDTTHTHINIYNRDLESLVYNHTPFCGKAH